MSARYGSGVFEHLQSNGVLVHGHKGAERSNARAKDRKLGFANKRSEAWWLFREALDPDQPGGSAIRLPPDTSLMADLASTKFTTTTVSGRLVIAAERKEDVVSRLGRSPDRGDAVVMAFTKGQDNAGWQALHETVLDAPDGQEVLDEVCRMVIDELERLSAEPPG